MEFIIFINKLRKHFLKRILLGSLSGLIGGILVVGIGGRLAMRLIAFLGGLEGGFSWGGSMEVVALGGLIGLISGAIYSAIEKHIPLNRLLVGGIYGLLVFCAILIIPIDGKGAAKGFPDLQTAIYLLFAIIFLVYGMVLAYVVGRIGGK